jgi:hypothetical protein
MMRRRIDVILNEQSTTTTSSSSRRLIHSYQLSESVHVHETIEKLLLAANSLKQLA